MVITLEGLAVLRLAVLLSTYNTIYTCTLDDILGGALPTTKHSGGRYL